MGDTGWAARAQGQGVRRAPPFGGYPCGGLCLQLWVAWGGQEGAGGVAPRGVTCPSCPPPRALAGVAHAPRWDPCFTIHMLGGGGGASAAKVGPASAAACGCPGAAVPGGAPTELAPRCHPWSCGATWGCCPLALQPCCPHGRPLVPRGPMVPPWWRWPWQSPEWADSSDAQSEGGNCTCVSPKLGTRRWGPSLPLLPAAHPLGTSLNSGGDMECPWGLSPPTPRWGCPRRRS